MISLRIGFFFFSSRRRHTRFDCDWSSDVYSSDLAAELGKPVTEAAVKKWPQRRHFPAEAARLIVARARDRGIGGITLEWVRSEEHTSELQSQSNLVCRLLLEKKKKHKELHALSAK